MMPCRFASHSAVSGGEETVSRVSRHLFVLNSPEIIFESVQVLFTEKRILNTGRICGIRPMPFFLTSVLQEGPPQGGPRR